MDCRVLLGLLIHEGEALGVEPKHLGIVMIFFVGVAFLFCH